MNFGEALATIKAGKKAARAGWNGKGMFIYLTNGREIPFDELTGNAKNHVTADNTGRNNAYICPHIDMKAADGTIVIGWLASQTDMLADDWEVIE